MAALGKADFFVGSEPKTASTGKYAGKTRTEIVLEKINKIVKRSHNRTFYNINTNKKNSINQIVRLLNTFSEKILKIKHIKAPAGYDVSFSNTAKVRKNPYLALNLKKTFNWYNSKKL